MGFIKEKARGKILLRSGPSIFLDRILGCFCDTFDDDKMSLFKRTAFVRCMIERGILPQFRYLFIIYFFIQNLR
ncbi:hypothetical protein DCO56_06615 [Sphingobacterium athyrii]|uniref:Uncharacterized protein n=1 Tax=Sphingobacterium athyrii TaxID=2152717 RepID=A0A363NV36_9SPHI|nr:hypothetical protein DCO56_06615 [Sphingobacterium athyrii]